MYFTHICVSLSFIFAWFEHLHVDIYLMTERTPKSLDGYRQIPNFIILYNSSQKYLQDSFLASLTNKSDDYQTRLSQYH